jgi:hypothetical protein
MGQLISILFVIVALFAAASFTLPNYRNNSSVQIPPQPAAVIESAAPIPAEFSETGTLVFYPNNVGPVPYLFYQDKSGRTVAKALTFSGEYSSGVPSSWSGAHISVMGQLDNEHVVVSHLTYLSGP